MISGVEREGQDASQVPSTDTGAAVNRGGEHRGKGGSESGPDTSLWHLAIKTSLFSGHGPPLGKQLWEVVSLQLENQHLMFHPSLASGKTDGRSMLGTTLACRWERRMEKSEPGSLLNQVPLWSHPVASVQPSAPPQSCKGMQRIENLLSRPCGTRQGWAEVQACLTDPE